MNEPIIVIEKNVRLIVRLPTVEMVLYNYSTEKESEKYVMMETM